jgi:hypothetical protein
MVVVLSPYLSAGFVFNGPKFQHYKLVHPVVTNEIDTKHQAVYAAHSKMLDVWVTLTSFMLLVSNAFAVLTFGIFLLSDFIGLPVIGMVGTLLGLLQLPLIIPGLTLLAGYVTWVLTYFKVAIPAFLVTVTDFMPKIIDILKGFSARTGHNIDIAKILSDKYTLPGDLGSHSGSMIALYSLPLAVVLSFLTVFLLNVRFLIIGMPEPTKEKPE